MNRLTLGNLVRLLDESGGILDMLASASIPDFIKTLKDIANDPVKAHSLLGKLDRLLVAVRAVSDTELG